MTEEKGEKAIYEIGFHLNPALSEENVGAEVAEIRSLIEKKGGTIVSEDFPKARVLSYTIIKKEGSGKQSKYDRAFFGWVKFELPKESIGEIKEWMDARDSVLRHLIMKTVRESTLLSLRPKVRRFEKTGDTPSESLKEKPEISQAELDKTIEELVIE